MVALNAENWKCDSERQTEKCDSKRQIEKCESERQTENRWWLWTPKLKSDNDGFECRNWEAIMMALNAETEKWWLWTLKLRNDGGSERAKLEKWLWTPNWKCDMMTLNVINREWMVALNAKLQGNDEGDICHSVACRCKSQSIGRV